MPRTKKAWGIVGWQRHSMMRDIAAGVMSPDEIAEKYGVPTQHIYDTRYDHKAELQAILDDWANQASDIWAVQKHNRWADMQHDLEQVIARLAELKEDAERATEVMRRVDPDAAPVRVPAREFDRLVNLKIKLRDQIERSTGQDATTIDRIAGDANTMTKLFLLGLAPSDRVKAQKEYLTGVDQESPPADLSGFTYDGGAGMTVSEVQAKAAADEQRYVDAEAQRAFAKRYDELLQLHGIVEDLSHLDGWVPAHVEDAVREAEERFARDYPDAELVQPDPATEPVEEDEAVEIYRAMPPPKSETEPADEPASVGFQAPAPVVEAETVDDEPVEELPPVASEVEQAARGLAVQIWNAGRRWPG
jgi:hypothetical protein